MKAKRKHRDTTRLTARERMLELCGILAGLVPCTIYGNAGKAHDAIERALQAHARQALARERLRHPPVRRTPANRYTGGVSLCKIDAGKNAFCALPDGHANEHQYCKIGLSK